jgi:hypothetical protein
MIQAPETFWTLCHDAAHWEFEVFLILIFDGIIGAGVVGFGWPRIKKHWQHHLERDKREAKPTATRQSKDYPWSLETMRIINELTPDIKGKAFEPDWFLLRQRLEAFEDGAREKNGDGN